MGLLCAFNSHYSDKKKMASFCIACLLTVQQQKVYNAWSLSESVTYEARGSALSSVFNIKSYLIDLNGSALAALTADVMRLSVHCFFR